MSETIPFEPDAVRRYLDECIRFWRRKRDGAADETARSLAVHYVDAFQSVRSSLFGETLPSEHSA